MRLRVQSPIKVEVDEEVDKVSVQSRAGQFTLLPRHVDTVLTLDAGILLYEMAGREKFMAVNGGVAVKVGDEVLVSTPETAQGESLEALEAAVDERFKELSDIEQRAEAALQKMQADFVRRLTELEEPGRMR